MFMHLQVNTIQQDGFHILNQIMIFTYRYTNIAMDFYAETNTHNSKINMIIFDHRKLSEHRNNANKVILM